MRAMSPSPHGTRKHSSHSILLVTTQSRRTFTGSCPPTTLVAGPRRTARWIRVRCGVNPLAVNRGGPQAPPPARRGLASQSSWISSRPSPLANTLRYLFQAVPQSYILMVSRDRSMYSQSTSILVIALLWPTSKRQGTTATSRSHPTTNSVKLFDNALLTGYALGTRCSRSSPGTSTTLCNLPIAPVPPPRRQRDSETTGTTPAGANTSSSRMVCTTCTNRARRTPRRNPELDWTESTATNTKSSIWTNPSPALPLVGALSSPGTAR